MDSSADRVARCWSARVLSVMAILRQQTNLKMKRPKSVGRQTKIATLTPIHRRTCAGGAQSIRGTASSHLSDSCTSRLFNEDITTFWAVYSADPDAF